MPDTSPSTGPVEWVALTFPGPALDPAVARPLGDLVAVGTDDEFAAQKARLLG